MSGSAPVSMLIDWPTEHLIDAARIWRTAADQLEEQLIGAWQDALATEWDGAGGAAMRAEIGDDRTRVCTGPVPALREADRVAVAGASDLRTASNKVRYLVEDAQADWFAVGEDGSVTDTVPVEGIAEQLSRQDRAHRYATEIARHGRRLVELDRRVGNRITGALTPLDGFGFDTEGDGGAGALGGPFADGHDHHPGDPPDDPKAFARWWDGLTDEQKQDAYAADHTIGNHPGMPFTDKDVFNRRHLDELAAHSRAGVYRLQDYLDDQARPHLAGRPESSVGQLPIIAKLQQEQHRLAGYQAVQKELAATDGPRRYLGFIDEQGRAAVAIGDPDTATRNATFIPGTGQDLAAFGGSAEKSLAMYKAALAADPENLGANDVAVTTWMGYDRPMDLPHAALTGPARTGAAGLDAFQDGMRASHLGGPSIDTVIGHSYGSTLAGAAAADGHHLAADNFVAVGSPGVLTEHAGDLDLDPGAGVYALRADHDIIGVVTDKTLGHDPTAPGFGATRLAADPGPAWPFGSPSIAAHSSYWTPDNPALDNLGAIIAGTTPPYVMSSR